MAFAYKKENKKQLDFSIINLVLIMPTLNIKIKMQLKVDSLLTH